MEVLGRSSFLGNLLLFDFTGLVRPNKLWGIEQIHEDKQAHCSSGTNPWLIQFEKTWNHGSKARSGECEHDTEDKEAGGARRRDQQGNGQQDNSKCRAEEKGQNLLERKGAII